MDGAGKKTLTTAAQQAEGDKSKYLALAAGAALLGSAIYTNKTGLASVEERLGALEIKAAKQESSAFVFIKPHAVTEPVKALVKQKLGEAGVSIVGEGEIAGPKIDDEMLIDTHYGAIAEKAVVLKPTQLAPSAKALAEFEKAFGLPWTEALANGMVYNARDACAVLGVDGEGLDKKWSTLTRGTNLIKFGGGFYCGQVDGIFIINGFYMSMRGKFTKPTASIYYILVQWPTAALSWADFRGNVLGATNPREAASGSLRKLIADDWKNLGLEAEPNTGDNGVHASASPFEALAERAPSPLFQSVTTLLACRHQLGRRRARHRRLRQSHARRWHPGKDNYGVDLGPPGAAARRRQGLALRHPRGPERRPVPRQGYRTRQGQPAQVGTAPHCTPHFSHRERAALAALIGSAAKEWSWSSEQPRRLGSRARERAGIRCKQG